MSEQDIPAEGVPQAQPEAPAENTAAGSQPVEQPSQQTATEAAAAGTEITSPPSTPAAGDPAKPQGSGSEEPTKPKSRRSAEFRIGQLTAQRDEYKTKYEALSAKKGEQPADDDGDPQPDDNAGKQPDISKLVEEEVTKRLNPVMTEHSKAADDAEINELFSGDNAAHRSEFEPKVREAWKLPQYKDLAASDVFKILNYDKALTSAKTQGVEEHKKAQKEAKESSGSGTSVRSDGKQKTAWEMTDEEFKATTDKVRAGG